VTAFKRGFVSVKCSDVDKGGHPTVVENWTDRFPCKGLLDCGGRGENDRGYVERFHILQNESGVHGQTNVVSDCREQWKDLFDRIMLLSEVTKVVDIFIFASLPQN